MVAATQMILRMTSIRRGTFFGNGTRVEAISVTAESSAQVDLKVEKLFGGNNRYSSSVMAFVTVASPEPKNVGDVLPVEGAVMAALGGVCTSVCSGF